MYKEVFPVDTKSYKDRSFFNELLAKDLLLEHLMRKMGLAKTTKRVKLGYEILKLEMNGVWEMKQWQEQVKKEKQWKVDVVGVTERKIEK